MTGLIEDEPVATCPSCLRQLPAEDMVAVGDRLVCDPCQAEGAKAEQRRDSIDAAWAAVEATLPTGWVLGSLIIESGPSPMIWTANAGPAEVLGEDGMQGSGGTPVRALRDLAANLAVADLVPREP